MFLVSQSSLGLNETLSLFAAEEANLHTVLAAQTLKRHFHMYDRFSTIGLNQ